MLMVVLSGREDGESLLCAPLLGIMFIVDKKRPKESKTPRPEENEIISFGHRLKYICVSIPSAKKKKKIHAAILEFYCV